MSSAKLTCPQCQAPLRFLKAPTPGKAIRCPGCQLKFTPPENVLAALDADEPTTLSFGTRIALCGVVTAVLGAVLLALWQPWSRETGNAPELATATSTTDTQAPVLPKPAPQPAGQAPLEPAAPSSLEPPMPAAPTGPEQAAPSATPPKKSAPKTYAELKRPNDLGAAPGLATINTTPAHPLQAEINAAIAKGVAHLQRTQLGSGSWAVGNYQAGYAALGGLALLEGGVPADDPSVHKAAEHVRNTPIGNHRTYQVALAILFLDRLGDPQDVPVIQSLAMQVIAGQSERGGWGYECPVLTGPQVQQLYKTLKAREPKLPAALAKESQQAVEKSVTEKSASESPAASSQERPKFPMKKQRPGPAGPPGVLQLPAGPNHPLLDIPEARFLVAREDNSNTQFALMALWAARRHGVPAYATLMLAAHRLAAIQNPDGGWGYNSGGMAGDSTPSMTCVGLLGLAMGHGLMPPSAKKDAVAPADPRIEAGLKRLGAEIQAHSLRNLYFAWSVERVAMLYNLPTIGNKDWYDLGARQLLKEQVADGAWRLGGYPSHAPPLDTSFAVLFLKRTNLVQDLSDRLPLFMAISDPDAGPRR
jgi:hypothetical protein